MGYILWNKIVKIHGEMELRLEFLSAFCLPIKLNIATEYCTEIKFYDLGILIKTVDKHHKHCVTDAKHSKFVSEFSQSLGFCFKKQ